MGGAVSSVEAAEVFANQSGPPRPVSSLCSESDLTEAESCASESNSISVEIGTPGRYYLISPSDKSGKLSKLPRQSESGLWERLLRLQDRLRLF